MIVLAFKALYYLKKNINIFFYLEKNKKKKKIIFVIRILLSVQILNIGLKIEK